MTSKSLKASKEPSKKRWWDYVFNVLTSITVDLVKLIPAALIAISTVIARTFTTFQQIPWLAVCLTYAATIAALLIIAKILRFNILSHLHALYNGKGIKSRALLSLALIGSLVTPIAFVATITPLISSQSQSSSSYEAQKLFPQAADLGPVLLRTHAANGEAYYTFFEETPLFGPNGYVRITFRNYGSTGDYNSGWVFFFLRGADLSRYKGLRFLIRGETGSEKIGIKAKDAKGVEVGLILDEGPYLRTNSLTTEWQEATIPFTHFGNVDFSLIDNFSFFTRGDIARTVPQTFDVGGFRLLP